MVAICGGGDGDGLGVRYGRADDASKVVGVGDIGVSGNPDAIEGVGLEGWSSVSECWMICDIVTNNLS